MPGRGRRRTDSASYQAPAQNTDRSFEKYSGFTGWVSVEGYSLGDRVCFSRRNTGAMRLEVKVQSWLHQITPRPDGRRDTLNAPSRHIGRGSAIQDAAISPFRVGNPAR